MVWRRRRQYLQMRHFFLCGGNHSQFAHYGHQLFDGAATIPREQQQALTRAELLGALESAIR